MSDDDDGPDALVIDNGSGKIKAGFAGNKTVSAIFPSYIGKRLQYSGGTRDTYIGEEAQRRRSILSLKYPIEYGIVTDWEDMEKIWHYLLYDDLRVTPEEHPVMLTEPVRNPKYNRQKMAQVMFETFQVPSLYVAVQALLSLYAAGRTSGLVLESGEGTTHTIPVFEGYGIAPAIQRSNLAGREATNYLMRLLNKRDYSFATTAERETIREIKEKVCYVAEDYEREMLVRKSDTKRFELPDGQTVNVGCEAFQCTEALFRPSILDVDALPKRKYEMGVSDMIYSTLKICDMEIRPILNKNIILSGGNTMHRGFQERVQNDIVKKAPRHAINVIAPPERRNSVWIGGSILGSLTNYKAMWIPKSAYEEYGPTVVHKDSYMAFDPDKPQSF